MSGTSSQAISTDQVKKLQALVLSSLQELAKAKQIDEEFSSQVDQIINSSLAEEIDEAKQVSVHQVEEDSERASDNERPKKVIEEKAEEKLELHHREYEEEQERIVLEYVRDIRTFCTDFNGTDKGPMDKLKKAADFYIDSFHELDVDRRKAIARTVNIEYSMKALQEKKYISTQDSDLNAVSFSLEDTRNLTAAEEELKAQEVIIKTKKAAIKELTSQNKSILDGFWELTEHDVGKWQAYLNKYYQDAINEQKRSGMFSSAPAWVPYMITCAPALLAKAAPGIATLNAKLIVVLAKLQNQVVTSSAKAKAELNTRRSYAESLYDGRSKAPSRVLSHTPSVRSVPPKQSNEVSQRILLSRGMREELIKNYFDASTMLMLDGLVAACGVSPTYIAEQEPRGSIAESLSGVGAFPAKNGAYPSHIKDEKAKGFIKDTMGKLILGVMDVKACTKAIEEAVSKMSELKLLQTWVKQREKEWNVSSDRPCLGFPKTDQIAEKKELQRYYDKAKTLFNGVSKGMYFPLFDSNSEAVLTLKKHCKAYKVALGSVKSSSTKSGNHSLNGTK